MHVSPKQWTRAAPSDQLAEQPLVMKQGGKQIALFRAAGGVFAVDNRCPHEGYPLAKGTVDQHCQLTCNWHNWKFRLTDGECLLGGDDVRAYPAQDRDGFIWVDLSDPPAELVQRRILKGLRIAFERQEFDRICREVTRLKFTGSDPLLAVRQAIDWSCARFEFGFTHAYAAAADWLAEARRYEGDWERQLICIAETVDHMAFDALRHPEYTYAPASSNAFAPDLLTQAIEAEDRSSAEGLVARAFDDGLRWQQLERGFVHAALRHFNDFGHSLIYVYKTRQLVEMLPQTEVQRALALALVRSLCYATREDLIPEFSGYALAREQLAAIGSGEMSTDRAPDDCPFPANTAAALDWVVQSVPGNIELIYDRLLEALARNLLHYETAFGSAWDRPVSQNVGWLNFTHGLTFANAVRNCCYCYPKYWPQGLLQMACFVGRNHHFLDLTIDVNDWVVADETEFFTAVRERMIDHGFRDPIFSAHLVKTPLAVEEELARASPSCRRWLLAGLNRFLHSPLKQKHTRRLARQAIDLVELDYGGGAAR